MNNQMDDFAIQPGVPNAFKLVGSEANSVAPGKRPCSCMSPTIVLKDGQPIMTVGAAGGPKIITQVVLLVSNVIDLHDDLAAAMARPRFHHQWSPGELWIEQSYPPEIMKALALISLRALALLILAGGVTLLREGVLMGQRMREEAMQARKAEMEAREQAEEARTQAERAMQAEREARMRAEDAARQAREAGKAAGRDE